MYIYQSGKLYLREDGHLVGVEIYPHKVTKLPGTETKFTTDFEIVYSYDVCEKFGITEENPYIFPREESQPEVIENEPTDIVKKPTRGRPRSK